MCGMPVSSENIHLPTAPHQTALPRLRFVRSYVAFSSVLEHTTDLTSVCKLWSGKNTREPQSDPAEQSLGKLHRWQRTGQILFFMRVRVNDGAPLVALFSNTPQSPHDNTSLLRKLHGQCTNIIIA